MLLASGKLTSGKRFSPAYRVMVERSVASTRAKLAALVIEEPTP